MPELPEELDHVMIRIERSAGPVDLHDIEHEVEAIATQMHKEGCEVPATIGHEIMAFAFRGEGTQGPSDKSGFFQPLAISMDGQQTYLRPNPEAVSRDILGYWKARASEASHPVLKARYADLVCDLSDRVCGKRAGLDAYQTAVDSYAAAIEQDLYEHRSEAVTYADRALALAQSINDQQRVQRVVDAILHLDPVHAIDDDGAGIGFDLLVGRRKLSIADEQGKKLVDGQEHILARGVHNAEQEDGFPFSVDRAAMRLASLYRSQQKHEETKRVMGLWARAKVAMAKRAPPMLGAAWLREVYEKLNDFGCTDTAEKVAVVLLELSADSMGQMVQHTEKVEISKEELERLA